MLVDERLLVVKTLGLLIELRGLVPGLELPPLRLIHLIGHRIISMTAEMQPVYTDIGKKVFARPCRRAVRFMRPPSWSAGSTHRRER